VLGNNLISSSESTDFNFPIEPKKVFKDKYKNDEIVDNNLSNDLVKKNELTPLGLSSSFSKGKKNIAR